MNMSPISMDLQAVLSELREGSYRIGVFGEFSTGKSTFLNALMGEDILSVATEPTTATPTRIQYARVFNVLVYGKPSSPEVDPPIIASHLPIGSEPYWARIMKDGVLGTLQHETTSIRRFLERWTKEGQDADKTHEVLIQLPQPFLKGRIALIDTPGVNTEFTKHQRITERVLEDVDVALCLVDARQGGKASEMRFIQSVAEKAALTRVVVNKIDLIDEDEREELLEAVHGTLQSFWPSDRGPCPKPWTASSLASLDPECRNRYPKLAEAFNGLRNDLKGLAESQRPSRILVRCGNWDHERLQAAQMASEEGRFAEAHECLLDVLTLHQEAGIDIPESLVEKIQLCEEAMKGATSRINEAHALVDKAALILLRNEPNDEVRDILRQAGEIFLLAQERDPTFEKLAKQALGEEASRYLFVKVDLAILCDEAEACLEDGMSDSEKQRGVAILRQLTETGFARAQALLGACYLCGIGVSEDSNQAVDWLCKAAIQGNADAQYFLGGWYTKVEDLSKADLWLRKAAAQGHSDAQEALSEMANPKPQVLLGLDLGSSKIAAVVVVRDTDGALSVTGVGIASSEGEINDINLSVLAINKAVEEAMLNAGQTRLDGIRVSVDGIQFKGENLRDSITIASPDRVITIADRDRVMEQATKGCRLAKEETVLHRIPQMFHIKGQREIRNPVNMIGETLEAEVRIIVAPGSVLENINRALHLSGLQGASLMYSMLASAEAVLSREDCENGAVVVDIGDQLTHLGVFLRGTLFHSAVIPIGGIHFTKDLEITKHLGGISVAERIKRVYGTVLPSQVDPAEMIELEDEGRLVSRRELAKVLHAMAVELFNMILEEIGHSGLTHEIQGGVHLIGGGALLPHLRILAQQVLGCRFVVMGRVSGLQGLQETLDNPLYTNALGAVKCLSRDMTEIIGEHSEKLQNSTGG
jgi:cell division protein FtsA